MAQQMVQRRQRLEKKQVAKSEGSAAETEVDPEGHQDSELWTALRQQTQNSATKPNSNRIRAT
jgi:hypothetical protein